MPTRRTIFGLGLVFNILYIADWNKKRAYANQTNQSTEYETDLLINYNPKVDAKLIASTKQTMTITTVHTSRAN